MPTSWCAWDLRRCKTLSHRHTSQTDAHARTLLHECCPSDKVKKVSTARETSSHEEDHDRGQRDRHPQDAHVPAVAHGGAESAIPIHKVNLHPTEF